MPCRQEFPNDYRIQPSMPQPEAVDFDALAEALQTYTNTDTGEAIDANDRDSNIEIARRQKEAAHNEVHGKLPTEDQNLDM